MIKRPGHFKRAVKASFSGMSAIAEWGTLFLLGWSLWTHHWFLALYAVAMMIRFFAEVDRIMSDEKIRDEIIESH